MRCILNSYRETRFVFEIIAEYNQTHLVYLIRYYKYITTTKKFKTDVLTQY